MAEERTRPIDVGAQVESLLREHHRMVAREIVEAGKRRGVPLTEVKLLNLADEGTLDGLYQFSRVEIVAAGVTVARCWIESERLTKRNAELGSLVWRAVAERFA